jgi:hypothetical protein
MKRPAVEKVTPNVRRDALGIENSPAPRLQESSVAYLYSLENPIRHFVRTTPALH